MTALPPTTTRSQPVSTAPPVSPSPAARAWRRFRADRRGYWSLILFSVLVVVSLMAELVSNDRPIVAHYEGRTVFPIVHSYPETDFGGDFATATDYLDPFIRGQLAKPGNWAIYPLNSYRFDTLNYFSPVRIQRRLQQSTGSEPMIAGAMFWPDSSTDFGSRCSLAWP